jgi:hypothetical protein
MTDINNVTVSNVTVVAARLGTLHCACGRPLQNYDVTANTNSDSSVTVHVDCPHCHERAEINLMIDVGEDFDEGLRLCPKRMISSAF